MKSCGEMFVGTFLVFFFFICVFGFHIAKQCPFWIVWVWIFGVDITKRWRLWAVLVLIVDFSIVLRNGFEMCRFLIV